MASKKGRAFLLMISIPILLFCLVIEAYSDQVKATIEYQYDEAGNIIEKKVTYETNPDPITINSGAPYTNITNVTLTLYCTLPQGCYQMKFSNDGGGYYPDEPFATTRYSWPLTPTDGPRTVSVMFSDTLGNWSPPYGDTILLDRAAPFNPTFPASESHGVQSDTWQNSLSDPAFTWSGASDSGSGVKGYYWYFGADSNADPQTWTVSPGCDPPAVSTGTYYLRVKTEDNAGNKSSPVTLFIFRYDLEAPTDPTSVESTSHTVGNWSNNRNIAMSWSGATDAHSGVYGYSYEFSQSATTVPDAAVDTQGTNATGASLGDGSWYFHLRTRDMVGNWTSTVHRGPYHIEGVAPTNPIFPATETHGVQSDTWQNSLSDPAFTWSGASDGGSGVKGYYWYFGTDSSADPQTWTLAAGCDPPAVSTGTYYLRVKTEDNAGNKSSPVTLFIFKYDGIPPTGKILVDSGAVFTDTTNVFLTLSCNDNVSCSKMQFSNGGNSYSQEEDYNTTTAWALTPGDETKTVYVKFRDTAGNWSSSYADTIVLNTTCSSSPVRIARTPDTPYSTLQAAYDAASEGDTIQCLGKRLIGDLTANPNKSIQFTLEGGYDCGYPPNVGGMTPVKGTVKIQAGKATIRNMVLEK